MTGVSLSSAQAAAVPDENASSFADFDTPGQLDLHGAFVSKSRVEQRQTIG
jgi:hypothetical protein